MSVEKFEDAKSEVKPFQLVVLILSVYVLAALLFQLVFKPTAHTEKILAVNDFIVCMIFLYDFFYRFATSSNKWRFLRWGWIDFISSIPTLDIFRWGRVIRIFRILRLLRAFKSTKTLIAFLFKKRAESTLAIAALISFILVVFSSIAILTLETSPSAHIQSVVDAMWWAFSAISSTGSGDAYPITTPGKILAVILSICGLGLFGTITAFIAKMFLEPEQMHEDSELVEIKKQLAVITESLEKINKKLSETEK
jgi:voltage-gated potassium channel